ncbi:MAG: hypothetical protein KA340_13470 [Saprospiraceae bacterium]|jgi:hypothetical protein|nr:hypothetical protein [Saprospiraceae bacterium]
MINLRLKQERIAVAPVDFSKLLIWPWRRCKVRILVVADGGIDFSTNGFGLSELITKALNSSGRPYVDFIVKTAHRNSGIACDSPGFRFDNSQNPPAALKFNNANFDQVWLFGVERNGSLPALEMKALTDFMNAGGGVFATGDHENLGQFMCSEIPRVRSMRKWYWPVAPAGRLVAPDGASANRLDTTVVGDTANYQFDDQSDETPQNIIPRMFTVGTSSVAHPLLSKSGGIIRVLPDHAHEGECVVPTNLTEKVIPGDARDEYPVALGGGARVQPQIVAISYSGAGQLTDAGKPAVNPRCFGAICAYDGHLAGVGRVSVDATWHHFLNINLNGTGSSRGDTGYYVGGVPNAAYHDIIRYFRNIAIWLSPRRLQFCFRFRWIYYIRYSFPLIWELHKFEYWDWRSLLDAGSRVRVMLEETFSHAEIYETAKELLAGATGEKNQTLVNALAGLSTEKENIFPPLLKEDTVINLVLGATIQSIVNQLPEFPNEAAEYFSDKSDDKKLEAIISEGLDQGLNAVAALLKDQEAFAKRFNKVLGK